MTLWTIQNLSAWKMLQSRGCLRARRSYLQEQFYPAYRWMKRQMRQRLGSPPVTDCYPLWAWFQWQDRSKKRPDLRFAGHIPAGETGVLVEFHAEASEVLLSDFELWHYVLNYWYLPHSRKDEERFEAILASMTANTPSEVPASSRDFHAQIRKSWDKIFDILWSCPDIALEFAQKQIQATLWELDRNQIANSMIFKAR